MALISSRGDLAFGFSALGKGRAFGDPATYSAAAAGETHHTCSYLGCGPDFAPGFWGPLFLVTSLP